jgi:hypothetical protein
MDTNYYQSSYTVLIITMVTFLLIMFTLKIVTPNSLNKSFGKQIFFTGPMLLIFVLLIMEYLYFKQNPYNTFLYSLFNILKWSPDNFNKLIIFVIVLVGLFTVLMLLGLGDVFQTNPPENNVQTIMNFIIIAIFVIIAGFTYKHYANKDEQTLDSMSVPKEIRDAIKFRNKYVIIFAAFMFSMFLLYILNPFDIMSNYLTPIMFFTLFMGMCFMIIIVMYNYFLDLPIKDNKIKDENLIVRKLIEIKDKIGIAHWLIKLSYILAALAAAGLVIYGFLALTGVFKFDETSPKSWISTILNFLILFAVLGIIFRFLNLGVAINDILEKNAYLRFLVNVIFYIPCLVLYVFYYIFNLLPKDASGKGFKGFSFNFKEFTTTPTKPFEFMMLGLSLLLLGGYFTWTKFAHKYFRRQYLKQGGQVLVNEPVPTDKLTNVTSFQELSGRDIFDYQYALSFWYYLDAFPPSISASYNELVSLLSYGGNPAIKYSSTNNTLYITIKDDSETEDVANNDIVTDNIVTDNIVTDGTNQNITSEQANVFKISKDSIKENIEQVKLLTFGKDLDSDGNQIIYKHPNVQLQKWNHVLLNYSGGTLDVFYNGKLVKTAIKVVPYMRNDMLTVGTENGVSGNIANLTYFDKPLDIKTIDTLYVELKDKNDPSIPSMN